MGYFGPTYSLYFIKGDYPGGDPATRTLYRGNDKEVASKRLVSAIERVKKFDPSKQGAKMGSQLAGFTVYYRGKPYMRIESIVEDGIRKVVRS